MVRHDEERPVTTGLITDSSVPEHWTHVLATLRANRFTRLSWDDVCTQAAGITIVSPTAEVASSCFATVLERGAENGFAEVVRPTELVPGNVPAGTWIFLPHRQDGWTELETTSARVRAGLVKENTARDRGDGLTLIEYGVNLWMWAEPPSSGGDPVCHAGELISWEAAWALDGPESPAAAPLSTADMTPAARPPIYFGLPDLLRRRRRDG